MPCWFFAAERMAQIAEGRKRKRTEFFNGIKEAAIRQFAVRLKTDAHLIGADSGSSAIRSSTAQTSASKQVTFPLRSPTITGNAAFEAATESIIPRRPAKSIFAFGILGVAT
jgi:hypothetical protein